MHSGVFNWKENMQENNIEIGANVNKIKSAHSKKRLSLFHQLNGVNIESLRLTGDKWNAVNSE